MLRNIESLRKEPKSIRDRYAFYGAAILTMFVAGFWVISLPTKFVAMSEIKDVPIQNDESGGFVRAVEDIKKSFTASLMELKQVTSTTTDSAENDQVADEEVVIDSNVIDIDAMFATSTKKEHPPQVIRIATSSQKTATSTVTEND